MFKKLLGTALLAAPLTAWAQQAPFDADTLQRAAAVRDGALAQNHALALVKSLTQEVGPRAAGSGGDQKAVFWAMQMLQDQGFANVRAEPVTVPHWVRGDIEVKLPGRKPYTAVALGGSPPTANGPVLASVLRVESIEALEALPEASVAGQIVFFDVKMPRSRDGSGYGTTVAVRGKGTTLAAAKGASAVVIRSVGTSTEDIAHTGSMRFEGKIAPVAAAALSNVHADALATALAANPRLKLSVYVGSHWAPDALSANVIGEVPGASDEIVLLGAHLDSWDITPGANDDAAGVSIVTEAARLAAQLGGPLQRTLRVVLYANEEFGISGGSAYAQRHAGQLPQHVVAMEADFGAGAVWRVDSKIAEERLPAVDAIVELLQPLGVARGGNEAHGGADIGPISALGVPMLGPVQDGSLYFDVHHTVADNWQRIDTQGLSQNVAVYATLAFLSAQHGPGFGRLAPAEPAQH